MCTDTSPTHAIDNGEDSFVINLIDTIDSAK